MKYFTMEELDYISKELIENPSKETIKRLNEKYNGEEGINKNINWIETPTVNTVPFDNIKTFSIEPPVINNTQEVNNGVNPSFGSPEFDRSLDKNKVVTEGSMKNEAPQNLPSIEELKVQPPVWEPISTNINNTLFNDSTKNNNMMPNQTINSIEKPNIEFESEYNNKKSNFELPRIEPNANNISNLQPNNSLNNQVPFNGNLWDNKISEQTNMMQTTDNFNSTIEPQSSNSSSFVQTPFFQTSPSPVNNSIPISESLAMEGPTMFGQFEQNFNNNNAA